MADDADRDDYEADPADDDSTGVQSVHDDAGYLYQWGDEHGCYIRFDDDEQAQESDYVATMACTRRRSRGSILGTLMLVSLCATDASA